MDAEVVHAAAENGDRSFLINLCGDAPQEALPGDLLAAMELDQARPLVRLRFLDEGEQLLGIEPQLAVVAVLVAAEPLARRQKRRLDGILEGDLLVLNCH